MSDSTSLSDFANNLMEDRQQAFLNTKPVVGQKLFLIKRQRNAPPITDNVTVKKVGTKYFTLDKAFHRRFHIDTKREADTHDSHLTLYASSDCYDHEEDKRNLAYKIQGAINQVSSNPLRSLTMVELGVIANLVLNNNKDEK